MEALLGQLNNLGFQGDGNQKNTLIKRMEDHIRKDELAKGVYIDSRLSETGVKGCAVTCIAYENLFPLLEEYRGLKEYEELDIFSIYKEANRLLNINGIGPIIDNIHERTPMSEQFSLKLLKAIQIDVDYTDFSIQYVEHAIETTPFVKRILKGTYECDNFPELYSKVYCAPEGDDDGEWQTSRIFTYIQNMAGKSVSLANLLLDFLEQWNRNYKEGQTNEVRV